MKLRQVQHCDLQYPAGGSSGWVAEWGMKDCSALVPIQRPWWTEYDVIRQIDMISNLTVLKKKKMKKLIPSVDVGWNHGLFPSFGSTLMLLLNNESIPISWYPAKVISFFEQFDLLWIRLTNAGLILIISILCSFLVIPFLFFLFFISVSGEDSKGTCWLHLVRIWAEDKLHAKLCNSGKCNLPYLCFCKIKTSKCFSYITESLTLLVGCMIT